MAEFPLFCYGTLISSVVREKILGDQERLSIKPASLKGYAVMKVAQAHYPALVKAAEDQVVLGVLVNGLSDIDMSILDKFEGINYSREARSILAEDGSCTESLSTFLIKLLKLPVSGLLETGKVRNSIYFLVKILILLGYGLLRWNAG